MKKRIHIVVNPASGTEVPILYYINQRLPKNSIEWTVSVTQKVGDARHQVAQAALQNVDVVAVYGGDGTVMEAAQALFKSTIPLAIIPGGTANVMAKELGLPINIPDAIDVLKNSTNTKVIDMALLNNQRPFLIRLNLGILADMVKNTDRNMKNKLGKLAYGVGVAKEIINPNKYMYKITIDGKKYSVKGISMVIANSGNIGIQGVSMVPHISVTDNKLDIIVFKKASITSVVEWFSSHITSKKPTTDIKHWKGKEVFVEAQKLPSIICDDEEINMDSIHAKVVPNALSILVP